MPIEFTVRTDDLKRAARQLQMNRGEFKDTDIADLVVSASVLEMKAVGTESSIAANGKQTGSARLPLKVFVRVVDMAKSYHQRESTILVDNGYAKVGRTKASHPDIRVGQDGLQPISIPPNASALDTLAVASMMTPEQIADAGLRERVENAQKRASAAIGTAVAALKEFGITSTELGELVDRHVEQMAKVVQKAVKE